MTIADSEHWRILCDRFYDWCVRQCDLEISESFPHVKTIRAHKVLGIVECIERWSLSEQRLFALGTMTDNIGTREQVERVTMEQRTLMKAVAVAASEGYGPRSVASTAEWFQGAFRPKASDVRKALKRDLCAVLGPAEKVDGTSHWLHRTQVGPWTVETYVQSGGDARGHFEYTHTISVDGTRFTAPVFPAGWWGISGNASWDRVRTDDIDGATRAASALCRWFIAEVPEIFGKS